MEIRILLPQDITNGFLETMATLSPVHLSPEEALTVYWTRGNHIHTYVALDGERVAGTATLLMNRKFIHHGGTAAHVEDVAVHPEYQGKGIGRMLVERLIQEAKSRNCYKIVLDCSESVKPFYDKLGFKQWATGMSIRLDTCR